MNEIRTHAEPRARSRRAVLAVTAAVVTALVATVAGQQVAAADPVGFTRVVALDLGDDMHLEAMVDTDLWDGQTIFMPDGWSQSAADFRRSCDFDPDGCAREVTRLLQDAQGSLNRVRDWCPVATSGRQLLAPGWWTATIGRAAAIGGAASIGWSFAANQIDDVDVRAPAAGAAFFLAYMVDRMIDRFVEQPGYFSTVERLIIAGFANAAYHVGQVAWGRILRDACPDLTGIAALTRTLPVERDIEMGFLPQGEQLP